VLMVKGIRVKVQKANTNTYCEVLIIARGADYTPVYRATILSRDLSKIHARVFKISVPGTFKSVQ